MTLEDAFFPVREEQVYNQHNEVLPGYKQLVNDNDNKLISVHKDTYRTITNNEAYVLSNDFIRDNFRTTKCDTRYKLNDKQFRVEWWLHDYSIPFKNSEIFLKATMRNSYDGSFRFMLDVSFAFLICTNGLTSDLWDIRMGSTHRGTGDIKLEHPNMYSAIDSMNTIENYLTSWLEEPTDDKEWDQAVDYLCLQPTKKDKSHVNQNHKNYIMNEYNDNYKRHYGDNKFSAYQAVTHWSTHYPSESINTRYDRERKVANMRYFH
jgi:hypothetical protein